MKKVKFLIFSDLHLESNEENKKIVLLTSINKKIEEIENSGDLPVVVLAGDIHNSSRSYPFMQEIKASVVFVAGNHEFWEGDYYKVLEELKNNKPENVNFLNNDLIVIQDRVIIGTTLWTDLGMGLNPDLFIHGAARINDMSYIKAEKWYDDIRNVEKLRKIYAGYDIEEKIKNKYWNGLIETEENMKAWQFLGQVDEVFQVIAKADKIRKNLINDFSSQFKWKKITQEIFDETIKKIDITRKDLSWDEYVRDLYSLHNFYSISEKEKDFLLLSSSDKNKIFQKIRNCSKINEKKITIVSHHLPFYEELLVADYSRKTNKSKKIINKINQKLFWIRSGLEYMKEDYIYQASRGHIEKHEDITHIINYYNDGHNNLGTFLKSNIDLWIHGHEHSLRYSDYVKGIRIAANPLGSRFSIFSVDEKTKKISLHENYFKYNNIKPINMKSEFNAVMGDLAYVDSCELTKDNLNLAVKCWLFSNYYWDEHIDYLTKMGDAAKKIIQGSVAYVALSEQESGKELEERLGLLYDSYNYNLTKLIKLFEESVTAYSVRGDENFSYQSLLVGRLLDDGIVYQVLGGAKIPSFLTEKVYGATGLDASFIANENIEVAIKFALMSKDLFENDKSLRLVDIKENKLQIFEKHLGKIKDETQLHQKINNKLSAFYKKVLGEDKNNIGFFI